MREDIREVLIDEATIAEKVRELGAKISADYAGSNKKLILVSVLKGSVIFMADLMRAITIPMEIDFMTVSSYGTGAKTSGVVKITRDLDVDIKDMDLLLVEDILDSGLTLSYLKTILLERAPHSIKIVTLLDKPERRKADLVPDYFGFVVPDEFVVGYGLDYSERYRNLPFVGVLRRSVYDSEYNGGE